MAGKAEDDGKKRVAGDKEIKGVFVCVFADALEHPQARLLCSPRSRPKPIGLSTVSLAAISQGRHRQTAAIKP